MSGQPPMAEAIQSAIPDRGLQMGRVLKNTWEIHLANGRGRGAVPGTLGGL